MEDKQISNNDEFEKNNVDSADAYSKQGDESNAQVNESSDTTVDGKGNTDTTGDVYDEAGGTTFEDNGNTDTTGDVYDEAGGTNVDGKGNADGTQSEGHDGRQASKMGVFSKGNRILFVAIVIVLLFSMVFRTYVVSSIEVVGNSMEPNLSNGDVVWINKIATPERNDIAVVLEGQKQLIKRIVAIGGDSLTLLSDEGGFYIKIAYVEGGDKKEYCDGNVGEMLFGITFTLKEDEIFLLGDNRGISADSREKGVFKLDDVVGVAN